MRPHTLLFAPLFLIVSTLHAEEPLAPLDATPAALEARAAALRPGGGEGTPASSSAPEEGGDAPLASATPESAVESAPASPTESATEPAAAPATQPAPAPVPEPAQETIPPVPEPAPESAANPATPPAAAQRVPVPGDCAVFREGGAGYILKAPTYYLKGKIVDIYRRPHYMGLCPDPGRTRANYRREDWLRLAEAYPCVSDPAKAREVEAVRVKIEVADWDTPWSVQHGRNGWLMRGHFLDVELKEGVVVEIDGTLLEYCED